MRIALLALAAQLGTACMTSKAPRHHAPHAPFPGEGARYAPGASRPIGPLQFDHRFRSSSRDYNYLDGVAGVNRARYPETSHPDAAFAYVRMGARFERAGDLGAAARAYWAALGLTARTLASRRQREEIRHLAYAGLASLARHKRQPEWAALLSLCAGLAGTYARSDEAAGLHAAFYDELEQQKRVQARIDAERRRARRNVILQAVSAGLGAATATARAATGISTPDSFAAELGTHLQTAAEASRQSQELDEATREAMAEVSASVGQLRQVTARDVLGIETGKEFVARQVAWYLAGTADPTPYLKGPLASYARTRPPVARLLAEYRAAVAGDRNRAARARALEPLVRGLLEAERHVASYERFGIVPGPRYLAAVCSPGSGMAVACHVAAVQACRAGVADACGALAVLYSGGPAMEERR